VVGGGCVNVERGGGWTGVEWDRSGIGTEELEVKRRKEEGGKVMGWKVDVWRECGRYRGAVGVNVVRMMDL